MYSLFLFYHEGFLMGPVAAYQFITFCNRYYYSVHNILGILQIYNLIFCYYIVSGNFTNWIFIIWPHFCFSLSLLPLYCACKWKREWDATMDEVSLGHLFYTKHNSYCSTSAWCQISIKCNWNVTSFRSWNCHAFIILYFFGIRLFI